MGPTGMLLQNLSAQMDRNLLIVFLNIFTAILYTFVPATTLSSVSNSSFPSSLFIILPDVAVVRSHISSLPSFCFIRCKGGGGEVCKTQGDYVFVQRFAQLPGHGSGLRRLTLFQQWIIMTLRSMLPALFWRDTIKSSNFQWVAKL